MKMKAKQPRSARSRLILTMELAVILPAATLVLLSARHLQTIQRDRAVEAAIQRDFSQVLAISEKQINHKAYELMDDVRNEFPVPGEACSATLDRILGAHPYVAHLMLYDPEHGFVMRSRPDRLKDDSGFRDEAEHVSKMMEVGGSWNTTSCRRNCRKCMRRERLITSRMHGCREATSASIRPSRFS